MSLEYWEAVLKDRREGSKLQSSEQLTFETTGGFETGFRRNRKIRGRTRWKYYDTESMICTPDPWTGILALSQDPIFISGDEKKQYMSGMGILRVFRGLFKTAIQLIS